MASAGNEAKDSCVERYDPITTPDKLLVGSTTEAGKLSSFSNYGACVHVQVPFPLRPPAPPTLRTAPATRCPPGNPCRCCTCLPDVAHVCQPSRPPTSACARPRHTSTLILPTSSPSPNHRHACAHTGPRLQYQGGGYWLKQHQNRIQKRHQHGGSACVRRCRPGARGGLDSLGGAGEGSDHRRLGGGLHRPFCKCHSRWHAQPLPHRRRRNHPIPKHNEEPWTAAVATGAAAVAAVAALATAVAAVAAVATAVAAAVAAATMRQH